jgi:hypothetical protein
MPTKPRLITTVSAILIVAVLAIVGAVTKAQMNQSHTQIILNLLNGQQYFGVPHVYEGVNYGLPTKLWPVYYGLNNASQYWIQGNITSSQPVLELVPARGVAASAMFWSEYYSGVVKVTMIGTYSKGASLVGDGLRVYLFIKPTMWSISPNYNYSSLYGNLQSSTPYIVVWWNPLWQFWYKQSGATGQWNVWIESNPNGNNPNVGPYPSPNLGKNYVGWDGIGTGYFEPNPGDWINVTVTYDSSNNTLSGVAVDLNHTGWEASFTLNLTGYYTPPSSGNYVFGVGALAISHYANWALLYVAITGNIVATTSSASVSSSLVTTSTASSMTTNAKLTPSAVLTWVTAAVVVIVVVVLIVALLMGRRSRQ